MIICTAPAQTFFASESDSLVDQSVGFVVNFRACAVSEFQIQLVGKTREHLLFTAHQEILIQYVENNLKII